MWISSSQTPPTSAWPAQWLENYANETRQLIQMHRELMREQPNVCVVWKLLHIGPRDSSRHFHHPSVVNASHQVLNAVAAGALFKTEGLTFEQFCTIVQDALAESGFDARKQWLRVGKRAITSQRTVRLLAAPSAVSQLHESPCATV